MHYTIHKRCNRKKKKSSLEVIVRSMNCFGSARVLGRPLLLQFLYKNTNSSCSGSSGCDQTLKMSLLHTV